jgi:hypothetical protein
VSTKRPQPGGRPGSGSGSGSGGSGSSRRPGQQPTGGGQADVGEIARAVSTSFLILVFGGLVQPVASSILPLVVGQFWLIFVAVVAFALAGWRCGRAGPVPPLYGAGGALGAFALVVPLQFLQGTFEPLYAAYTLIAALVIGGATGQLSARLRSSS